MRKDLRPYRKGVIAIVIDGGDNYYRGQVKDQFLVRFTGNKKDIRILEDEIRDYKWVLFEELKDHLLFPNQYGDAVEVIKELLG
ncbi:hypothetical protein KKG65_04035 [Patescibacteria group bacterium]|nr:hypothetical protein [Patescibacteria group bacterium]